MPDLNAASRHMNAQLTISTMYYYFPVYFIFLLFFNASAHANEEIVNISISKKITATASYIKGDNSKPAILMIHGFLSTRNHATLKNLSIAIADGGYTTLAPTLSLDINQRKQSLACEAIHTHTLQNDIREIELWMHWLHSKGHKNIILLGHSFGSLHMLVYLKDKNPDINYAIATSLVDLEHAVGTQNVNTQLKQAKHAIKTGNNALQEYKISYCKQFVSTPASFVSYAEWNKDRILRLLSEITTPVHIIMGSNDKRMDKNWPSTLIKQGSKLSIIDGANHFFSNEYEFELHDKVLEILNSL